MDRIQIIRLAKWVAAVGGGLMMGVTVVSWAAPIVDGIIQSGPLPIPGEIALVQLGKQLQTLQQNNDRILQRLDAAENRSDQRDLEWYQFQLQQAQADAGPRPNKTEQKTIQALKDQVNIIRLRLKFPPIQ